MRLQSGKIGEIAAERWFLNNGWRMVRTQPAIQILGSKPGKHYGRVFTVRMVDRGGVPDYTGFRDGFYYVACEVKEASGDSMPASRLDKEQRAFMASLPNMAAMVGIFWTDHQKFTMHPFIGKGSYKYGEKN